MEFWGKLKDVYWVLSKPEKHGVKAEENLFEEVTNHLYDSYHMDWQQDTFLCNSEMINNLAIYSSAFKESKLATFAGVMKVDILAVDKLSHANTLHINRKNLYDFSMILDKDGEIRFSSYGDFQNNQNYLKDRARYWDEDCWDIHVQKWNNKICIHNSDAAHHLAAMYRQCHEQNLSYYLKAKVYFENIDYVNLENLLNDYYIFYSDRENVSFVQECYRAFYGNKNLQSKIYYKEFGPREPVLLLNKENTFNRKMVNFLCYRTKEFIPMNEMIKQSYLKK